MAKRRKVHPKIAQLLDAAEAQGCQVEPTQGGHYRVVIPGHGMVHLAGTPSDKRGVLNARARLRQRGVDV